MRTPPIAFASRVLPQPDGPCRRTPRGGCTPVWRYTSGCVSGMATSSSTFSTHRSIPPRSARRTVGGAYSLAIPPAATRLRLLPSSPRVVRGLRLLLDEAVGSTSSEFTGTVAAGSERRGSSGCGGGGVRGALAKGGVCTVFKFILFLCQFSCIDLLRELGPWLTPSKYFSLAPPM